jgi:hypothetical protein
MTKKKIYQRPAIELFEAETEEQLLALSSVSTTGLDENESLDYGDTSGNKEKSIWDEAW